MGPVELVLLAMAGVPFALGGWLGWRMRPQERPSVPVWPLLACVAWMLPALMAGLLLGPALRDRILQPGLVFAFGGADAATQLRCAAWVTFSVWLPAGAAAVWLVLSPERKVRDAAAVALAVAIGYAAAVVLGWPRLTQALIELGGIDAEGLVDAVTMGAFALGMGGATFTGTAVGASRSRASLRLAAICVLGLPAWALGIGALASPPDPTTQLLIGIPIGLGGLLGLAVAAVWVWWGKALSST